MENLERFNFNNSTIVVVQNVNSISKSMSPAGEPEIKIFYTSNKKGKVLYALENLRDNDFYAFNEVHLG